MNRSITSSSESETMRVAADLAQQLRGSEIIALEGPLGAGKTCFVRGLAQGLGIDPGSVSSPTFIICQEYGKGSRNLSLAHLDAYRLGQDDEPAPDELETIGWEDLLRQPALVLAIEWPSRIAGAIPAPRRIDVQLEHVSDTERAITITSPASTAKAAEATTHTCTTCRKAVAEGSEYFPFCSERCRLVDLGKWFSGSYSVSRPVEEDLDSET